MIDKKDKNSIYNAITYLYHKILETKIKKWENIGKVLIEGGNIGDIALFNTTICIRFYELDDTKFHLHMHPDGSFDIDSSVDIETLYKQYELLKKLILKIT